jgi:hypothetical protein
MHGFGHGARFSAEIYTREDAIGSHACSLEANTRVTNGIPLGSSPLLPVDTVNCVATPKDASTGTYTNNSLEVQTITSTALGAGVVPPAHHASAVKALTDDISARGHHLSVGAIGQKWLLRELTAAGAHDDALQLSLQTTYPSFGYWLANGTVLGFNRKSVIHTRVLANVIGSHDFCLALEPAHV